MGYSNGPPPDPLRACHEVARIAMHGRGGSLGLAVATGIVLDEAGHGTLPSSSPAPWE